MRGGSGAFRGPSFHLTLVTVRCFCSRPIASNPRVAARLCVRGARTRPQEGGRRIGKRRSSGENPCLDGRSENGLHD